MVLADKIHNIDIRELGPLSPLSSGIVDTTNPDDPAWNKISKSIELRRLLGGRIKRQGPTFDLKQICNEFIKQCTECSGNRLPSVTCPTDNKMLCTVRDILNDM
jgi:hypothetical protein